MLLRKKPSSSIDYIVVGLGNITQKYSGTRHNVGFDAVDAYASLLGVKIDRSRFSALTGDARTGGKKILLMKPQTYMNASGRAVQAAMNFYKLPLENVLVIYDDASLPVGKLRIRADGSAGGHNGIKSIIAECGGENFPRIKIGVGQNEYDDLADWVLSKFPPADRAVINKLLPAVSGAAEEIILRDVYSAANKYNGFTL